MGLHVVIVERCESVREALYMLLKNVPVITTITNVTTIASMEDAFATHIVDLVLIEQALVTESVLLSGKHFVIIAEEVNIQLLQAVTNYNICAYLLRENASEALLKIVLLLVEKECTNTFLLNTTVLSALLDATVTKKSLKVTDITMLTERECEVLSLLHKGRKNCEIAVLLGIETTTVRTHIASVLKKLDVTRYQVPSLTLPEHFQ